MTQIKRTVYLYDLQVFISKSKKEKEDNDEPIKGESLKSIIDKAFSLDSTLVDDSIFLDKYTLNDRFFFGSIGKEKDMALNPLARVRNEDGRTTKPILPGTNFEHFTYFLIEFETARVAVLYSSEAPALKMHLCHFLHNNMNLNLDSVRMPIIVIDLEKKLLEWNNITKVSIAVSPQSNLGDKMIGFSQLNKISENHAEAVKLEIKLTRTSVDNELIKMLSEFDPSDYKSFKVYGDNKEDLNDSYDIVEKLLIKKASLILSDDRLANRTTVFNELTKTLHDL